MSKPANQPAAKTPKRQPHAPRTDPAANLPANSTAAQKRAVRVSGLKPASKAERDARRLNAIDDWMAG